MDGFIKQSLKYYSRLQNLPDDSLVKKALNDQKRLNLSWYVAMEKLSLLDNPENQTVKEPLCVVFTDHWNQYVKAQSKLDFYRTVKSAFTTKVEDYLTTIPNYHHRNSITKIRTSAHKLGVGRYKAIPRENRICCDCNLWTVFKVPELQAYCN